MRKRVHGAEITTDASIVKLGNLSADRCAQHLQQIAGEEGHIPKHYMMQEVRVAEQFTTDLSTPPNTELCRQMR